uniref:Uncharacterized protein n=1 Tax=Schistocephalus solidus TaxID=70667 RepID=A0A0X3PYB3_SCHSO
MSASIVVVLSSSPGRVPLRLLFLLFYESVARYMLGARTYGNGQKLTLTPYNLKKVWPPCWSIALASRPPYSHTVIRDGLGSSRAHLVHTPSPTFSTCRPKDCVNRSAVFNKVCFSSKN